MDKTPIYQKIVESVHQKVLSGDLRSGDRLPSMREMAGLWQCTPGTVQRAYKELARQGLVVSRPGQGTHVVTAIQAEEATPLRRLALIHQAETFLLEVLTAGYTPSEVEQAVRMALDRWRVLDQGPQRLAEELLRFVGSHDPAVALIAARFSEVFTDFTLHIVFAGSLGGLIALAEGEADIAGCHLWDEESDTYNKPFIQRLLPGRRVALLTLAHRRLGLITPPGNPIGITVLEDLARSGVRFVNRQRGAGTRVWFDAQLRRRGIKPEQISGYDYEVGTHYEIARAIVEGKAEVGMGVLAAAQAYHLEFIPLTLERYDLAIPSDLWHTPMIQALAGWLVTNEIKSAIAGLGGYDTRETGRLEWIG